MSRSVGGSPAGLGSHFRAISTLRSPLLTPFTGLSLPVPVSCRAELAAHQGRLSILPRARGSPQGCRASKSDRRHARWPYHGAVLVKWIRCTVVDRRGFERG